MWSRVMNGTSSFFVEKRHVPKILESLSILPDRAPPPNAYVAFQWFGLDVRLDPEGNITSLFLDTEYMGDEQAAVFMLIAPYVRPGSYVMFIREDARQFAWVFRENPATGATEAHEEDVVPVLGSEYRKLKALPADEESLTRTATNPE